MRGLDVLLLSVTPVVAMRTGDWSDIALRQWRPFPSSTFQQGAVETLV